MRFFPRQNGDLPPAQPSRATQRGDRISENGSSAAKGWPPIAIPHWVSHDLHGRWVKHSETGAVGRIGYTAFDDEFAVVMCKDGNGPFTLPGSRAGSDDSDILMEELELLDRDPEPWYDFAAVNRRRSKRRPGPAST